MTTVTQPLRDEHKELLPELEVLREAGDAMGFAPAEETKQKLEGALDFLTHHLIPHAQAEDAALYPVVGQVMGSPKAPDTMRRDHVEVEKLTGELAALAAKFETATPDDLVQMRRLLYGLYALIGVHFAKEEEVYLPILDAGLAPDKAQAMFEAMEAAAGEAKAAALAGAAAE